MAATLNSSTAAAVVVEQKASWRVYSAGAAEIDLQPDGRGALVVLGSVLNLNSTADLAQLRDLAQLLDNAQLRAALGF